MSSPIAIPTRRSPSPSSEAPSSTSTSTSPARRALYVPLHRRAHSDASSSSSASRPSSPEHASTHTPEPEPHPHIYTPAALLALRPRTGAGLGATPHALAAQAHIRESCPMVLANSRARKAAAFLARRAGQASVQTDAPPSALPSLNADANKGAVQKLAPVAPPAQPQQQQQHRATPRRTRPAGRGPERRRAALQLGEAKNWRAMRVLAPQVLVLPGMGADAPASVL